MAELHHFACVLSPTAASAGRIVYFARIEFPTEFVCLDFDLLAARPQPA